MDKQLSELTPKDFVETPVWFFPMDDSVESEETVRPVREIKQIEDFQVIVKTFFFDQHGNTYLGYIFWGSPEEVEYLKPVMALDDSGRTGIDFWHGLVEPGEEDFRQMRSILMRESFPIRFVSEEIVGLNSIHGELFGLYYLDKHYNVICKSFT
ncbi:hypothetical protein [Desulfatibacillum aliphaticivorans]|uniref:hypothetical protein n=1 Tax=Desulfatibacillum aliphaticivorans TaxID=218208 RepID=UPI000486244B|nr:hypothetical protein [Desulfatibacillum aliphaticivorans]